MIYKKSVTSILIMIFISIFIIMVVSLLISISIEKNSNMVTTFNLPRFKSDSEIAGPPSQNITTIKVNSLKPEKETINWTDVITKGPYDVVIIGDSFTTHILGTYRGKTDFLTSNLSILIIYTNKNDFFDGLPYMGLIYLTNNGFFKTVKSKWVILVEAERGSPISNLTDADVSAERSLDWKIKKPEPNTELDPIFEIGKKISKINALFSYLSNPLVKIKTWGINFYLSFFSDKTVDGNARFTSLAKPMFSHIFYASKLIYYDKDLEYMQLNKSSIKKINIKLNQIATKLQDQNITLIYIPGISSFTSHYPLIANPPQPRTEYYDVIESLNKNYIFINSEKISDELLNQGVIDLHGVGDCAHWNWPLTKRIVNEIDEIMIT